MIKLEMSVREILTLAASSHCNHDMFEKIVTTLEVALGVNQKKMVTITGGMSTDNRIPCIKAVRIATGWGLKEAKDWTDALVGHYNSTGRWIEGSNRISATLKTPEAAEMLLRDLTELGCEGFLT